jgi:4-alpha-glucanotransferase
MTERVGETAAHDDEYIWQDLPPDAPEAIRRTCEGAKADAPREGDPVRVVFAGTRIPWQHPGELVLEDGTRLPVERFLPPDLPLGYHDFHPDHDRWTTRVIVTPGRCRLPHQRQWGWAAQLYGARSAESWGMGDLADLRRLGEWSAALGAGVLLINPLGAAPPVVPQTPSPYYPSSRRFRNPLYLRIEEVPGAERLGPELQRLAAAGGALNADRHVDRTSVFRLKQQALRSIWAVFSHDLAMDRYCRRGGAALERFATWCALAEQFGDDWRQWPAEYRRPDAPAVQTFAREHADGIRYHQWLQWLLDEQLAGASQGTPIIHDVPVGFSPGGADAWEWQDLLALDCDIGAPPDAFGPEGQNWQVPPFIPWKLRAAAYGPFVQTIRATFRHAGGLRIDHVMALFRLWWIHHGDDAQHGVYVRYPADDLLGIVALESQRSGAFVIGEDLGTVEPGVRQRLARYGMLSFRVLWFEERLPPEWPPQSMAVVTTHDLPTIAGLWSGADRAEQEALGLPENDEMCKLRERYGEMLGVPDSAPVAEVIGETYRLLAEAPSILTVATLEDALAVPERPNMPGTMDERANWMTTLPGGLAALESSDIARRIAATLDQAARAAHGAAAS